MIRRLALLAGIVAVCAALLPRGADGRAIRIIYTTELHGNLMPCSCPVHPLGGLARRVGWVDSLRSGSDPDPLFVLDAGGLLPQRDDFPRLTDSARQGLGPLYRDAMKAMGYDLVAGVNIQPNEARLIERGGIRVAVVAADEMIDTGTAVANVRALGPVDLMVVLCDGDLSFATATARRVGASVAVASRGACFGGPLWQEGVLILGPGRGGRYVGLARIDVNRGGTVHALDVRLRAMDASVPTDPAWRARVEKAVLDVESRLPGAFTVGE